MSQLPILQLRSKRLTLDAKRQDELIEEIKHTSKEQLAGLEKLLDEHDQECLQLLNQKLAEKKQAYERASRESGHQVKAPMPSFKEVKQFFTGIFSSPEKFASFVTDANDELLAALEDTMVKMTTDQGKKGKIAAFFQQIRVHRSFADKSVEKVYKAALIEEIKRKDAQIKELDAAMEAVERELNVQKKK